MFNSCVHWIDAVSRPFISDVSLHPPNRTHVLRLHVESVVGGSLPDFGVAVMSGAGSGSSEYPVSAGRSRFMIGGGTDLVQMSAPLSLVRTQYGSKSPRSKISTQ